MLVVRRAISLLLLSCVAAVAELPALIPMPQKVEERQGELQLSGRVTVATQENGDAVRLIGVLRSLGLEPQRAGAGSAPMITLQRGQVENPYGFQGGYRLEVGKTQVKITAADAAGAVHAAETLRQLLQKKGGAVSLTCVVIEDWPAFPFRGFMLDTGRNYQSVDLIKEQIEMMARYKLNIFHFHFTDNPGWRLESKVHPKVTDAASMTRQPGKYYTHREFQDLVAFCKERQIILIPEMDMPGHTKALRKALNIESMDTPESRKIMKDLLTELASLAPKEVMPYIHIGTDEIRDKAEHVDGTYLAEMSEHIRSLGREVIGWRHGLENPKDTKRITQLWARANPLKENPFLDSRSTYINHMDPHEAVSTFLFQQSCRVPHGDERVLGGILASWPDIRIENERDQLLQNPVYPSIVTYGESMWRGIEKDDKEAYWANLPPVGTPEFDRFREFEKRLLEHKARFFQGKEFTYVKQTDLRWKIIGPFPNDNDVTREFPVEKELKPSYEVDGKTYTWQEREFGAATLYFNHFFGFGGLVKEKQGTCYAFTQIWSPKAQQMPVWVGFHNSSRSDRRGGVDRAKQGEWHNSQPWIRVNGDTIAPPTWKNLGSKNDETPFTDEDYFMREPSKIQLKQGWNTVLLKVPKRSNGWKWVSTFVPVGDTAGLRYSSEFLPQ